MLVITIAFKGHSKTSEAEGLYVGHDVEEALRIAKNPPPGFQTVHVYRNLVPFKRCPVISAPVVATPEAPAEPVVEVEPGIVEEVSPEAQEEAPEQSPAQPELVVEEEKPSPSKRGIK
jgi:hypothetical protein